MIKKPHIRLHVRGDLYGARVLFPPKHGNCKKPAELMYAMRSLPKLLNDIAETPALYSRFWAAAA